MFLVYLIATKDESKKKRMGSLSESILCDHYLHSKEKMNAFLVTPTIIYSNLNAQVI